MTRSIRIRLILAMALTAGAGGCLEGEQTVTVYPDGSGKMELSFTRTVGAAPDPWFDAHWRQIAKDPIQALIGEKGFVAWSKPVVTEDEETARIALTGYFDDIRRVDGGMGAFDLEIGPDGASTLETRDILPRKLQWDGDAPDESDDDRPSVGRLLPLRGARESYRGCRFRYRVIVPGAVTDSAGFHDCNGRVASLTIDTALLFAMDDKARQVVPQNADKDLLRKMEAVKVARRKVAWKTNEITDAQLAAFKKELADAKTSWAPIREKAEREKAAQTRAMEEQNRKSACASCGNPVREDRFNCPTCDALHHVECWHMMEGCSRPGCGHKK